MYRKDLWQKVAEVLAAQRDISIKEYEVTPEDFGFFKAHLSNVIDGNASENETLIYGVFSGTINGLKLDILLLNSVIGLFICC